MSDITKLLEGFDQCDAIASDELLSLLYGELRRIAAEKMWREGAGHTLQPTALVHEAWIRLATARSPNWKSRSHFLGAAAEVMRRVLVDHARRKRSLKRGRNAEHEELHESILPLDLPAEEILEVHDALEQLSLKDPIAGELVKLRYFVGMSMEEAAATLSLSKRKAEGIWTYARVWLQRRILNDR